MVTGRDVVAGFVVDVEDVFGDRLERVAVHSGWARGGTSLDLDLAVVLRNRVDPVAEVDRLVDPVWKQLRNHGALLVVTPAPGRKVWRSDGPFWRELRESWQAWDGADLGRELPRLPDPVGGAPELGEEYSVVSQGELAAAKWDLAWSSLYAARLSRSIASGGKTFPLEAGDPVTAPDLSGTGGDLLDVTSIGPEVRRRRSWGEWLVEAWFQVRYLGRPPGYDEAVRGAFRAVSHAVHALLLARTGRSGGTPRVDLPLAAHLLVRNGPLSGDDARILLRLFLLSRLAGVWGTWGGRSLYSASEAEEALEQARAFLEGVEPILREVLDGE